MNTIPIYPRLISKVHRQAEYFLGFHGVKPNAVLLGTDMLGAIVERGDSAEIHTDEVGAVFLDGLRVIPDGRSAMGIALALVE